MVYYPTINGSLVIEKGVILQNDSSYNRTLTVNGDVINNGIIRDNAENGSLSIRVAGNIVNNGTWNNSRTTLTFPSSQFRMTGTPTYDEPKRLSSYDITDYLTTKHHWQVNVEGAWTAQKGINDPNLIAMPTVNTEVVVVPEVEEEVVESEEIRICDSTITLEQPAYFNYYTGDLTLPSVQFENDAKIFFVKLSNGNGYDLNPIFKIIDYCLHPNSESSSEHTAIISDNILNIPALYSGAGSSLYAVNFAVLSAPGQLSLKLLDIKQPYKLYVINEGTPARPKKEEKSFTQDMDKLDINCVHGDVYKVYFQLNKRFLIDFLPLLGTYSSQIITSRSLTKSFYDSISTNAYQSQTSGIRKKIETENVLLAEITCQHHATKQEPVELVFEELDVNYNPQPYIDINDIPNEDISDAKFNPDGSTNLSEELDSLGKDKTIIFHPKEGKSIEDILKRDVKFSTEFSPSNALLAATLAELSYYNDEEFVTELLEKAGFENVKYYEYDAESAPLLAYIRSNYNFYIATRKQNDGIPIIYVAIRGTQEWQDVITDILAGLPVPNILLTDLNEFNFNERMNYSNGSFPFPATFYDYANLVYYALNDDYTNELADFIKGKGNYYALNDDYTNELADVIKGKGKLFIAGHSLGGAAANIVTTLLATSVDTDNMMTYTIGSPKFVNSFLAEEINYSDFNTFNIQHPSDLVTWIPSKKTHLDNIINLDDSNISNLDDDNVINLVKSVILEATKTHSSSIYINSLYHKNDEEQDVEQIATAHDIFERGTCRKDSKITGFNMQGSCHIDAEILQLKGQLNGKEVNTYYFDNVSYNTDGITKYEPFHHILKVAGDGIAEIQNIVNGVFNREEKVEFEGTEYSFSSTTNNESRIYANGDFTFFNSGATKECVYSKTNEQVCGENLYFKFDPEKATYILYKRELATYRFHFLGIHGN